MTDPKPRPVRPPVLDLSFRELECLAFCALGHNQEGVAEGMGVTYHEIKHLLGRCKTKLKSRNTVHSVWLARHRLDNEMDHILRREQ